jgi:hypothetical protein
MRKTKLFQSDKIPFTQVANAVLDDKRISFSAKGVYAHLMSKPDGWDFSAERIAAMSDDGKRAVLAALKELETVNLLTRVRHNSGRVDYILNKLPSAENAPGKSAPCVFAPGKSAPVSNKDTEQQVNGETNNVSNTLPSSTEAVLEPVTVNADVPAVKKRTPVVEVVEHFFRAKGWEKGSLPGRTFSSFVRPAKDLIDATGSVEGACAKIDLVKRWADERELSWSLETIFKQWDALENPTAEVRKKKAYIDGDRAYQDAQGNWNVILSTGEHRKYIGSLAGLTYR